jgi:hypothetical protein
MSTLLQLTIGFISGIFTSYLISYLVFRYNQKRRKKAYKELIQSLDKLKLDFYHYNPDTKTYN